MVSWGRGNAVYMLPKTAHEYPLYNRNFHLVEVRDQSLDTHIGGSVYCVYRAGNRARPTNVDSLRGVSSFPVFRHNR
jgi:hypothetical protein